MAVWKTPKTDWAEHDRFELEDYNRIKNNIYYLWERACVLFSNFRIEAMGDDITSEAEDFNVAYFNAFERNIEILSQNTYAQNLGMRQTFYANGAFIKWDELNRIENAAIKIKKIIESRERSAYRLPFRLGAPRDFQV